MNFNDLIKSRHFTKTRLAEETGLELRTLQKIGNGYVVEPRYKTLKALEEALDIPYDTILASIRETCEGR